MEAMGEEEMGFIVTVDGDSHEKKWGPLSRNAAWKEGFFWEDGNGAVKVFLEKGETRKEVYVEKPVDEWREWFLLLDKVPQPHENQRRGGGMTTRPRERSCNAA